MNKLFIALLFSIIVGNFIAWFHMQAQFKWEWAKSWYWIILGGVPISVYFIGVLVGFMNILVSIGM